MSALVLKAYAHLLRFDYYLIRRSFTALYDRVRNYPVQPRISNPEVVGEVRDAIDVACIWYRKEVLCLQRSAATTCLLKSLGIRAQLVLGAQHLPFKAHAWVEVAGKVVNDKTYVSEIYVVIDRC